MFNVYIVVVSVTFVVLLVIGFILCVLELQLDIEGKNDRIEVLNSENSNLKADQVVRDDINIQILGDIGKLRQVFEDFFEVRKKIGDIDIEYDGKGKGELLSEEVNKYIRNVSSELQRIYKYIKEYTHTYK